MSLPLTLVLLPSPLELVHTAQQQDDLDLEVYELRPNRLFTRRAERSRSVSLAGGARQQPSCHRDCTGGAELSASTRIAPHWTSQRQPMHNDDAVARRHRARRSHGRSRTQRTFAACAGASAPCIPARPAHPRAPQFFLHVCAPDNMRSRFDSPVTCAPAGGHQAAQCMAACPPPPRGAVGVRGGGVPRPSTPSCAGTSNCRTECKLSQFSFFNSSSFS